MPKRKTEWLTVSEVAERLGVSKPTVYRLIRAKQLKARRVTPRTTRVSSASVDALLQTSEVAA